MSCHLHVDVITKDDKDRVAIKVKGNDEEVMQMLLDVICAFAAKAQHELTPRQIVKMLNDQLTEFE